MGLKPAEGELNAALRPIFADIPNTHFVQDDLSIATQTMDEHLKILKEVMNAISKSIFTLQKALAKTKLISEI